MRGKMGLLIIITLFIAGAFWGLALTKSQFNQLKTELYNANWEVSMLEAKLSALENPDYTPEMSAYIQRVNPSVSWATATVIAQGIEEVSGIYDIPSEILLALAEVESTFNHLALSGANARGLIQVHVPTWLNPDHADNLICQGLLEDKQDLYDPVKNLLAGGYILKHYYNRAKDNGHTNPMQRALTNYYGGNNNGHYEKVYRAMGRYRMFLLTNQLTNEELV